MVLYRSSFLDPNKVIDIKELANLWRRSVREILLYFLSGAFSKLAHTMNTSGNSSVKESCVLLCTSRKQAITQTLEHPAVKD